MELASNPNPLINRSTLDWLMRERIEIAGGVLYVDSRLGEGTRIIAKLPSNRESKGGPPKETRP
jgi:signal transduction histidine kinase